jgi:hypothetical protein
VYGVIALAVLRLALKLELGPEYDSNAIVRGAVPVDTPTGSALARTTTRLALSWQSGISLLRVSGGLGAKVFFNREVADQDVLVGQLAVDERLTVGRFVDIGFSGDYYDAGQLNVAPPCGDTCNRHRDFRTGSATARISFIDDPGDFTLAAGWRGFQYKPDSSVDFEAVQATVAAAARAHVGHGDRSHELAVTGGYHIERRWFSGARDLNNCGPGEPVDTDCLLTSQARRRDWFHEASFELSYLGPVLLTVGYGLQLNLSDSFGQSLLRHVLTLRLAGRLPWRIYATVKAQLLLTNYLDQVVLDHNAVTQIPISIEDENRNALIVDLERPIGKTGVAVVARYSYYTNEISASNVDFSRHVVYLGVSYSAAWRLGKTARTSP